MPHALFRPALKTVYLDYSHLKRALLDEAGERRLASISKLANLCVTHIHLLELCNWGDVMQREKVAAGLDRLDLVWMREFERIERLQYRRWLKHQNGIEPKAEELFYPSFLTSFEYVKPEHTAKLLKAGTVLDFVKEVGGTDQPARLLEGSSQNVRLMFDDKVSVALNEISDDVYKSIITAKLDGHIAGSVLEEHQFLLSQHETEKAYLDAVIEGFFVKSPDLSKFTWAEVEASPSTAPFCYVLTNALRARRRRLPDKPPKDWSKYQGDQQDLSHLIGAAYCDVFSCDSRVSADLGDSRGYLGFKKELVGSHGEVLSQVEDQIAPARGAKA